jgi:hypothetical protein
VHRSNFKQSKEVLRRHYEKDFAKYWLQFIECAKKVEYQGSSWVFDIIFED